MNFCLLFRVCMLCLWFSIAFLHVSVAGEAADSISIQTIREVDVVRHTASQSLRLTAASPEVTVHSRDWTASGIRGVSEALQHIAGIQVRDYGGLGGMKTVNIRNLGAAHTAVMYDDIPVSNCQAGQIDVGRFSTANLSLLRLHIGNSNDLLAPALLHAYSGCMSMQTLTDYARHADSTSGWSQTLHSSYGTWNTCDASLQNRYVADSTWEVHSFVGFHATDGDYPFRLSLQSEAPQLRRHGGDMSRAHAEVNGRYRWGQQHYLQAKCYYYYSEQGLPGSVIYYNNVSHERLWDENCFAQLLYHHDIDTRWRIRLRLKYNHSWNRYHDRTRQQASTQLSATDIYRQDEYFANGAVSYRLTDEWEIAASGDWQVSTLRSNVAGCPFPLRLTSFTALRSRFQLSFLSVSASLLYTHSSEQTQSDAPHSMTGSQGGIMPLASTTSRFTPSVAVSFRPFATIPLSLRASWRQAFRLPVFNELYYYQLGNHRLRPELSAESNIGVTWAWQGLQLTADGYINQVKDKIVAFPTTFAWKMSNYGRARIYGADVNLAYTLPTGSDWSLSFSGNYSWQKALNVTDPTSDSYRQPLPYTAAHSGGASVLVRAPWFDLSYSFQYMSERYSTATRTFRSRLRPFSEHHCTLSREWSWSRHNQRLRLFCSLFNLTDCSYEVIQFYPMPGRHGRVGLQWSFRQ